jgi:DnaJ-domain-containing protein 1
MFERNRSTFSSAQDQRVPVSLTMVDGEILRGNLRMPVSGKLIDAMNNADLYFDLEMPDGSAAFLAKHSVRRVTPVDVPRSDQLSRRTADLSIFDPYTVLGLARGASPEEVKAAYHALVRSYHPDRFASANLPREMQDYAHAMLTRINAAYQQIAG